MTREQLEKRKRVMQRSIALGHCICDVRQPCPCEVFKEQGVCHCAGEHVAAPTDNGPVRLTQHVRNAGCASKIDKQTLRQVLSGLPQIDDPRVIIGASAGDDAGVIRLSPEGDDPGKDVVTVLTVDVFCPAVDDPYTFGQIAAANSLSDIYAMGAQPQVALSIVGFPVHALPPEAMRQMLRGGVDKMHEAGVCVIGGHSINDEEIKCGFAVVGTATVQRIARNAGARVGDVLVLSKPLGSGLMAFAMQLGRCTEEQMAPVARSMATLNRHAGQGLVQFAASAGTDVTGFSLLGHLVEIVRNSGVEVTLDFDAIPLFEGVRELARQDVIPGVVERNRESLDGENVDLSQLTSAQQAVLLGPETSGGILAFLSQVQATGYIGYLAEQGIEATVIGRVTGARDGGAIEVNSRQQAMWGPLPLAAAVSQGAGPGPSQPSCCSSEASCCESANAANATTTTAAPSAPCCASAASTATAPAPPPATVITSSEGGLPPAFGGDAFKAYMKAISSGPALGPRNAKLIALALSVLSKCEPCVKINADAARQAGASDEEIAEAIALGIAFGGAPTAMFYNTMRQR